VSTHPAFATAWLRQRREGSARVAVIEAAELASLDDVEALRLADALLAATPPMLRPTSGLVEQQRLFARGRR
jgi:hypothetical protein